jgi:RNA polymerase sigma-70 factor (ECF subfamily)
MPCAPSIFEFACVWWFMSASQAVFAGWMEIPSSAVDELARTESARVRAEEEALAALVSEYAGTLYRVSFSVLRNAADAEDAVQEAFLRVLRHRDTLDEVRDRRVWLIRIVWNIVLDRKRRAKTRPETDDVAELARVLPAEGLSAEDRAAAAQHHAQVLACVETLPAKEREVLMLSAFEELTSVEIAQVLGITESSVRSRLFRARNLMAGLLGRERTGNRDRDQGTGTRD